MKIYFVLIALFVFVVCVPNIFAQDRSYISPEYFEQSRSIGYFNRAALADSEKFILSLLQFKAPFRGGYRETRITKTGSAHSFRMTTCARQGGDRPNLGKSQIEVINQKISVLKSTIPVEKLNPVDGELYSTLILNDGEKTLRYDFVGQLPAEVKSILDFLQVEFEIAQELKFEQFVEEGRLLKEKYGDWQNKKELLRSTSVGFRNLKFGNTVLEYLKGQRQPVKADRSFEIPIYYALIFYPEGRLIGGAAGKGNRSDNPVSTSGVTWTLPEKTIKGEEIKKELLMTYNAIDETLTIDGKVYQLSRGDLLVIKMNKRWEPETNQLNVYLDQPIQERDVIMEFQKKLNIDLLQFPEK